MWAVRVYQIEELQGTSLSLRQLASSTRPLICLSRLVWRNNAMLKLRCFSARLACQCPFIHSHRHLNAAFCLFQGHCSSVKLGIGLALPKFDTMSSSNLQGYTSSQSLCLCMVPVCVLESACGNCEICHSPAYRFDAFALSIQDQSSLQMQRLRQQLRFSGQPQEVPDHLVCSVLTHTKSRRRSLIHGLPIYVEG